MNSAPAGSIPCFWKVLARLSGHIAARNLHVLATGVQLPLCVCVRVRARALVCKHCSGRARHSPGATHADRLEGRSIPSSLSSTPSKIASMMSTLHADTITPVMRAEEVLPPHVCRQFKFLRRSTLAPRRRRTVPAQYVGYCVCVCVCVCVWRACVCVWRACVCVWRACVCVCVCVHSVAWLRSV